MSTGYHPSEDLTREMDAEVLHTYQEIIGTLRWAIEIGRIDILLKVSLLSSHLRSLASVTYKQCIGSLDN